MIMNELPVLDAENNIAAFESMDLSELKDKTFLVSVSTGDRSKSTYLCTQIRGPFTFSEMCQEVGEMYTTQQHHAKVIIAEKDRKKPIQILDEFTVDYIEAHYVNIITEIELFAEPAPYTCRANIKEGSDD
jgi:hypothetical protein